MRSRGGAAAPGEGVLKPRHAHTPSPAALARVSPLPQAGEGSRRPRCPTPLSRLRERSRGGAAAPGEGVLQSRHAHTPSPAALARVSPLPQAGEGGLSRCWLSLRRLRLKPRTAFTRLPTSPPLPPAGEARDGEAGPGEGVLQSRHPHTPSPAALPRVSPLPQAGEGGFVAMLALPPAAGALAPDPTLYEISALSP
jgi:hypothetical protein